MLNTMLKNFGKYYSFKEQAMYTRIKLGAWTVVVFCSIMIMGTLSGSSDVVVPVQPTLSSQYYGQNFKNYENAEIKITGDFRIKEANFLQRLLLPNSFIELDVVGCLLLITLSIIVLKLLPHVHSQVLLTKDISPWIRYIGWTLILFCFLDVIRIFFYAMPEVERITHHEFIFRRSGYVIFPLQFYTGLGMLWVSRLYKKAFSLKQEQEFTI